MKCDQIKICAGKTVASSHATVSIIGSTATLACAIFYDRECGGENPHRQECLCYLKNLAFSILALTVASKIN
jgi:hypothetical protein